MDSCVGTSIASVSLSSLSAMGSISAGTTGTISRSSSIAETTGTTWTAGTAGSIFRLSSSPGATCMLARKSGTSWGWRTGMTWTYGKALVDDKPGRSSRSLATRGRRSCMSSTGNWVKGSLFRHASDRDWDPCLSRTAGSQGGKRHHREKLNSHPHHPNPYLCPATCPRELRRGKSSGAAARAGMESVAPASDTELGSLATVEGEEGGRGGGGGGGGGEGNVSPELAEIYNNASTWQWRGKTINYVAMGKEDGPSVVLIHGFGASIGHFRKNIPVLSRTYRVYAVDLLGFGQSSKPSDVQYSIELWAELILDFMSEVVSQPSILVGNSIGSLSVLLAGATARQGYVRGVVLLNCAGAMNNKAISDDWRIKLFLPLFLFIDFLLKIPIVAQFIFDRVKTRSTVKSVLQSVYCNREVVDEELVEVIMRPADDEGALNVFVEVITGPPGPRPENLVGKLQAPLLLLWGDKDPFTPLDGPIGRYFSQLPQTSSSLQDVKFVVLPNVGHCPHDDDPDAVHKILLPWMAELTSA